MRYTKILKLIATTSAGLFLMSASSRADFVEADLLTPGDARITRDTDAGLDWLDVTETQGISMTDILAGSGDWYATGWRHATTPEMCSLFARFFSVAPNPCSFIPVPHAQVDSFFSLFGTSYEAIVVDIAPFPLTQRITEGFCLDSNPFDPNQCSAVIVDEDPFFQIGTYVAATPDIVDPNSTTGVSGSTGHFLVRSTPPQPIPALGDPGRLALVMILAGLCQCMLLIPRPVPARWPKRNDADG